MVRRAAGPAEPSPVRPGRTAGTPRPRQRL